MKPITPNELRDLAKSAKWTGKLHYQGAFERAANRIEQLEKLRKSTYSHKCMNCGKTFWEIPAPNIVDSGINITTYPK